MSTIIATLFAAHVNKTVVSTDRTGVESLFTVSSLAEKTGTMKNGDKAEYLVLTKNGDESTVINLHPQTAKDLLTKGAASGLKIDLTEVVAAAVETTTEVNSEEQQADTSEVIETTAEVVVETTPEVNTGEQQADTSEVVTMNKLISEEKSDKPVSKKARAIALITDGWNKQLVRKDIIKQMMTELGLSAPGASTYYQNVKSGMWKLEETTEQAAD